MADTVRILFLCTGNACRSQMAEGWARTILGDAIQPASAGVVATAVDPRAQHVMREAGVDLSGQFSKKLEELESLDFDYVITLCDHAAQYCPVFPGTATVMHHPFEDPPLATQGMSEEAAILAVYRRVRDEIHAFVRHIPDNLEPQQEIAPPRLF
ncbi:MAG: arsenate reductase ArsC [Thermodesulfobacteriota bacterium]